MAYEMELWESDRPELPFGGGEFRTRVVRVSNLEAAQTTLVGLLRESATKRTARITLSDTRGRIWDLARFDGRDIELDSDLRDLSDQRPAGAAVPKVRRRGGPGRKD